MIDLSTYDSSALVAADLGIAVNKVKAVSQLLADSNTVPFIARYRKEVTGNLDEVQIFGIQERVAHYFNLESRRKTILESIDNQGKLTPELMKTIMACGSKTALEDIYLPYKPKRRTRATIAKERGLEPLADIIDQQQEGDMSALATRFVNAEKEVPTLEDAIAGACDIIAERISENADVRRLIRDCFSTNGVVASTAAGKDAEASKFAQYVDFEEPVATIPSHRYLAIRRGEQEGLLRKKIKVDTAPLVERVKQVVALDPHLPFFAEKSNAVEDSFKRLISPSVEVDVAVDLKMKSDRAAVDIFAKNLRNLLLAAPFGGKRVIAIDPGLRTGCKCAALDETGQFLETTTIYLTQGDAQKKQATQQLAEFICKHKPAAIAVGNGTGGRETEAFVRALLKDSKGTGIAVISVNEAGASIYSASEVARQEFADLDLTIRGAISIGRRLQDPLAELVKIDPKSIGVGQYQHDVHQRLLEDKLNEVVISCVNRVGVELNTASAPLLSRVSGIGDSLSQKIIMHRNTHGVFPDRNALLKVPGLGPRAFTQAAGFLRVAASKNPLDKSAVHPERYALVEQMARDAGVPLHELTGNLQAIDKIDISKYITDEIGEPTLRDILAELTKPGRDPRESFEQVGFREDIQEITDLAKGMELQGIVTNVTAFGAFVDVGVHQDGLVHISQLSSQFVSDPSNVVQAGDRITVWVMEVDVARKRIALSACKEKAFQDATPMAPAKNKPHGKRKGKSATRNKPSRSGSSGFNNNPFATL